MKISHHHDEDDDDEIVINDLHFASKHISSKVHIKKSNPQVFLKRSIIKNYAFLKKESRQSFVDFDGSYVWS